MNIACERVLAVGPSRGILRTSKELVKHVVSDHADGVLIGTVEVVDCEDHIVRTPAETESQAQMRSLKLASISPMDMIGAHQASQWSAVAASPRFQDRGDGRISAS